MMTFALPHLIIAVLLIQSGWALGVVLGGAFLLLAALALAIVRAGATGVVREVGDNEPTDNAADEREDG